jgi:hypothetical protein
MKLLIVGICHRYQYAESCDTTPPVRSRLERWRQYIDRFIAYKNIEAVLEEYFLPNDPDYLRSIARSLALNKEICYRMCDPLPCERKKYGFVPEDRYLRPTELDNFREERWLEAALQMPTKNAMLICGAEHTQSMFRRCAMNTVSAEMLEPDWVKRDEQEWGVIDPCCDRLP